MKILHLVDETVEDFTLKETLKRSLANLNDKLPVLLNVWKEYDELYPPLIKWLNGALIEMNNKEEKSQTKIRQQSAQWQPKYEKFLSLATNVAQKAKERVNFESDEMGRAKIPCKSNNF